MSVAPLLDEATFRTVVASTPLIAIDLLVRRPDGRLLLGLRNNRPAQGFWFVPGGRIRKGETLDTAFLRLTREELGGAISRNACSFLGVYEHFYEDSVFGGTKDTPTTHYIVLGYEVLFHPEMEKNLPLEQHNRFQWFDIKDILSKEDVHLNTKMYMNDIK